MTEFLEPKSGWMLVRAEQIAAPEPRAIVSGPFGSNIGKSFFVEEGIPVIRGNNLTLGQQRYVDDGYVFLSEEKAAEFKNCMAVQNDLVFTAAGTLGQVGIIPSGTKFQSYVISNKQLRLRVDGNTVEPMFAYYWFIQPRMRETIVRSNRGSSVPLITLGVLRNLPFLLPPLAEQRRIVNILSVYDDLIEHNNSRIEIMEEVSRRIFEEWFVRFRAPGCEGARRIDSPLGPIPSGWQAVPLSAVADVNPEQISKKRPPEFIEYIDIASVTRGSIDTVTPMALSEAPSRARRVVKDGDTIWSCVRPNRRSHALVLNPGDHWIASTGFAVLRPRKISFAQLYLSTTTDLFVSYLTNHATGAAYPAVKGEDFERALICLPPPNVVSAFGELLEPVFRMVKVLSEQNSNLRAQRDLLLPKLVSGEIDVSKAVNLKEAAE